MPWNDLDPDQWRRLIAGVGGATLGLTFIPACKFSRLIFGPLGEIVTDLFYFGLMLGLFRFAILGL